jgi:hypothetical protein
LGFFFICSFVPLILKWFFFAKWVFFKPNTPKPIYRELPVHTFEYVDVTALWMSSNLPPTSAGLDKDTSLNTTTINSSDSAHGEWGVALNRARAHTSSKIFTPLAHDPNLLENVRPGI